MKKAVAVFLLGFIVPLLSCGEEKTDSEEQISVTKSIETIDTGASSGHAISIAVDQSGNPGVSYIDFSFPSVLKFQTKVSGNWTTKTYSLNSNYGMYTATTTIVSSLDVFSILSSSYYSGSTPSGDSSLYTVQSSALSAVSLNATAAVKGYPVVTTDKNDMVHLAYFDSASKTLKYAKYSNSAWSSEETVDAMANSGGHPSIATDKDCNVHIVYYDFTNRSMKYATNKTGFWVAVTVASDINTSNSTYAYSTAGEKYWSLKADSTGYIHISYFNYGADSLYYATNASGAWVKTAIDKSKKPYGSKGRFNSLCLDSKDKVHISYFNQDDGSLRYITNKNGSWQFSDIDTPAVSTSTCGFGTSIAVDSSDNIHIAYQDYSELNGSNRQRVKYVKVTF